MQTSKVAQLRENVGTWTAPDGTQFYKHNAQLENGVQGEVLGRSPQAPYAVGDEVQYEEKRTQNGTRLKLRKHNPQYNNGGYNGGGSSNDNRGPRIMRQTAMKVAAHIVGEGKHFSEYVAVADLCVKYFEHGSAAPQQAQQAPPPQQAPQVETRYVQSTTEGLPF